MNRLVRATAGQWVAEARPAVVVAVAELRGSAPRDAGTRMLVAADAVVGTIGGGRLEQQAIVRARALLARGVFAPETERIALGPTLGQCCGGAVTLRHAPLDAAALSDWPSAPPRFRLQLHGAGHVGRAIATLLCTLDAETDWIDEREAEFPATTGFGTPWPAHVRRVCVDAVEGEVRLAPAGSFFLVLTHDHDLDARITEAVLRRGDFGYLGLIGSRSKRARFERRFAQRGIAADALARLHCPIGVPGVGGKEPEVIAAAVVAQLLQHAAAPSGAAWAPAGSTDPVTSPPPATAGA